MAKRIFDCFTFFNELDVLELRLNELHEHVDMFVLVESTMTFKGAPKALIFAEHKERYERFLHKIVHVVIDDMPDVEDPRLREHHQRRGIIRGLVGLEPEDIVIVSDVDEILRRSTIDLLRSRSGYFLIDMPMFQFFLNTRALANGWNKVFAYSYRLHEAIPDFSRVRVQQIATFEKFINENHLVKDGGWHFTFLGGVEAVRNKIGAYAHHGGYYDTLQRPNEAEDQLRIGYQLGRHDITDFVEVDISFPDYLRENIEIFVVKGLVKPAIVRIRELEEAFRHSEKQRRALQTQIDADRAKQPEGKPSGGNGVVSLRPSDNLPTRSDTKMSPEEAANAKGDASVSDETTKGPTADAIGADIAALFSQIRTKMRQYRAVAGRYYPAVLDGPPAIPRSANLASCRLLADRHDLIAELPTGGIFVEVGTLYGDFITKVIEINKPSHVHLFDLSFKNIRPENQAKLDAFGKVTYHTGDSSFLLSKLEDGSVDIVYVDGDHSYAGVWKDLIQALRVLKPDGYLVCNDFTNWDPIQCIPYGVFSAVSRFANEHNLTFEYLALQQNGFHDVCLRRAK